MNLAPWVRNKVDFHDMVVKSGMASVLFLLAFQITSAQEEVYKSLNRLFSGKCEFSSAKKGVQVKFMNGGDVYRIDFFYPEELKREEVKFNGNENSVSVECYDRFPNCVDRKIIKTKTRQPYGRFVIDVSDEAQARKFMTLFDKLFEE